MTLLLTSIALLLLGNLICWRGELRWRGQPYHSPQHSAGVRIVCGGTVVNIVGGVLLLVAVISWLF